MHIVTAFEAAQKNRNEASQDINKMAMEVLQKGDKESLALAQKLQELNQKVMAILDPLTE